MVGVVRSLLYITKHQVLQDDWSRLLRALQHDTGFLSGQGVMDYSLLVGVDRGRGQLVVGVIDYVRQYTWDKQLETWVKSSGTQRGMQCLCGIGAIGCCWVPLSAVVGVANMVADIASQCCERSKNGSDDVGFVLHKTVYEICNVHKYMSPSILSPLTNLSSPTPTRAAGRGGQGAHRDLPCAIRQALLQRNRWVPHTGALGPARPSWVHSKAGVGERRRAVKKRGRCWEEL